MSLDFAGMALQTLEQNVFLPALQTIEKQFSDQPLVRARLQQTIASTCRELGLLDLAMKPQRLAALQTRCEKLGNKDSDTLTSIRTMSSLLRNRGQLAEAEPLLKEALDGFRKEFGEDDLRTIECVNLFGTLRHAQGLWAEEAKFHSQALPGFRRIEGDDHADTLEVVSALGAALTNMGKFDEAEKMLLEAVQKLTRLYGVDSIRTILAEKKIIWAPCTWEWLDMKRPSVIIASRSMACTVRLAIFIRTPSAAWTTWDRCSRGKIASKRPWAS